MTTVWDDRYHSLASGRLLSTRKQKAVVEAALAEDLITVADAPGFNADAVWADDWEQNQILIPAATAKSRRPRRVPFDPGGRLALFMKPRRFLLPESHVFGNAVGEQISDFSTAWERVVMLAHDISAAREKRHGSWRKDGRELLRRVDLHWHDLRHECATRWLRCGLDLREIQKLLGHASISMIERYLNVDVSAVADSLSAKVWKRVAGAA